MAKLIQVEMVDDIYAYILLKDLAGVVYQLRVDTNRHKVP